MIELAVLDRDEDKVRKLISKFLSIHKKSLESRLVACDWYRRMGWYREGFKLILPTTWSSQPDSTKTMSGKQGSIDPAKEFVKLEKNTMEKIKFLITLLIMNPHYRLRSFSFNDMKIFTHLLNIITFRKIG